MFNTTNIYPLKDCMHEFNSGITLTMNIVVLMYILYNGCGWCRDPLAENLRKKVRELENENDNLVAQIDEAKEEYNTLSSKLRRANESLDNLRNVLEINRTVENDVMQDTQG